MYTAMTQEKYYMNIYIYSIINIIILLLNIQNESTCNEWVRAFLFIYKWQVSIATMHISLPSSIDKEKVMMTTSHKSAQRVWI